jgi:hypothetical protein
MKNIALILLGLLLVGATVRTGWSYSGQIQFRISEPQTMTLYHDPDRHQAYESIDGDSPYYTRNLDKGEYVLTIQGYYFMDLK